MGLARDGRAPTSPVAVLVGHGHCLIGRSTVTCAAEFPQIKELVDEGLALGGLWYSDHFDDQVQP